MTSEQKKMKKYTASIERRLNLPRDVKARVMTDFTTTIAAMREAGKSDDEIYAELGEPKKAAAELNEQMKDFAYRKSPWRFVFLAVSVLAGLWLCFYGFLQWLAQAIIRGSGGESASVGIIGGADGPTAIFVTTPHGSLDWDLILMAAVVVIGLIGYLRLRKCGQKK